MKKFVMMLTFVMSAFAISACNTMEGAGEDIERGGEEIQDASN